jgi:hypothetical protein
MVRIHFPPAASLVTPRPHQVLLGRMETPEDVLIPPVYVKPFVKRQK